MYVLQVVLSASAAMVDAVDDLYLAVLDACVLIVYYNNIVV